VAWNNTLNEFPNYKDYPRGRSLHELIEDQVERSPEAPALIFEARRLSYRELNAQANRLAHYLRQILLAGVRTWRMRFTRRARLDYRSAHSTSMKRS